MGLFTATPRTWAVGNRLSAALLNTQLRDFSTAFGAMAAYAPTWTAVTTNPAIGNGNIAAAYTQIQKTVFFRITLTLGSTTTVGSGAWLFTTPTTMINPDSLPVGACIVKKGGARFAATPYVNASNQIALLLTSNNALVTNTSPTGTWASGDVVSIFGTYEAA